MEIYEEIVRLRKLGRLCVVATIVECKGSSPQKQGAKMLLRDDGTILGTLGGGCMESEVIQHCRMAIRDRMPRTIPFELTERTGSLVCGGKVLVYIEPIFSSPRLIILGAGHVGRALATLARFTGFHVTVTDDRPEYANKDCVPDAHEVVVHEFSSVFSRIPVCSNTFVIIATRGHNHDLDAVKAALHTDACYVGLLGSRRKKAIFLKTLEQDGFTKEDIDRILTPVGIPIGSITPEEIAVSIMAQIIQYRRAHAPKSLCNPACSRTLEENGPTETASACTE